MLNRFIIGVFLGSLLLSCDRSGQKRTQAVSGEVPSEIILMDSWPREGPNLLWKYEGLGRGYGSPAVTREGIFINAEENGESYTVCLDHHGSFKWRSRNGKEFTGIDFSASYPGTRSAPAVKDGCVYAASGMGHLSCFDARDGKVIWNLDLMETFQGILGDFGYSETPVVDEDRVYCSPGGKIHNIVALDRRTGELIWSAPVNRDNFSYGTPVLLNFSEKNLLAGTSRNYIHVVDREDGRLLSSYQLEGIKEGNEHCNSVVYLDSLIYFVPFEEHGQGTVCLRLSDHGERLTEVWRNAAVMNVFEGFIVKEGRIYTTMETKKLLCLDARDGSILHSVRALSGNIVEAGGLLIIYGHNGTVQLFSLKSGTPDLKSEMRVRDGSGHHFSFPVIADGVMYIRHGDALMAYSLRQPI